MESDDWLMLFVIGTFTALIATIVVGGAFQIERTKTERAAIERGCPTPTLEAEDRR